MRSIHQQVPCIVIYVNTNIIFTLRVQIEHFVQFQLFIKTTDCGSCMNVGPVRTVEVEKVSNRCNTDW